MVFKRVVGRAVAAEAFVAFVIVGIYFVAVPCTSVALDAKVVVAHGGKAASPGAAFEQSLRKGYAGGNAILLLVQDGYVAVFLDIFKVCGRLPLYSCCSSYAKNKYR